jgi:hypothetical protein
VDAMARCAQDAKRQPPALRGVLSGTKSRDQEKGRKAHVREYTSG